jgi:CheY-like chemotaxis protein
MPFKVREILLVSSLYDALIVEEDGLISEMVIWEYRHLLLSSPPRVTHVASGEEALEKVKTQQYDLVITMSKNIGLDPFEFGRKIKQECRDLPVIILATDSTDLHYCQEHIHETGVDKAFFWYGDTSLFMAIVKCVEDKINVQYDTVNGNVQVIIVVEDSIRDYSLLLPVIYSKIVQQTQRSISDDLNEMQRLLRRRARPKILVTNNFEEGVELHKKYRDNILGIISDVKFNRNGQLDPYAGHDFIQKIKEDNPFVPMLLQSTDSRNRKRAEELGVFFINKTSPTLMKDIEEFLLKDLGFGDFIFKLPPASKNIPNKEIAKAANLEEFEKTLQKIPLESIRFHANRNDFSNWLMARCEFKLAQKLRPQKVSDFNTLDEMRKYLVNVFNESRRERQLAVMTDFEHQNFEFDSSYTKIGSESLGGKGRGIAFIRTLLARHNFDVKYPKVTITVPSTVAISTDEFDRFINENNLYSFINENKKIPDEKIAKIFLEAKISNELKQKLASILKYFKKPLAIRSSSLLEDSQNHPFAGIYSTYMLPNNNPNNTVRFDQLCKAIQLVYASVFYKEARAYIESTTAKIEEEKMAIIIQELIGNNHNGYYFPTFSGVAQSYNFYPISHQKREDGIVSLAVGLGYEVVGGEKVLRFSPKYPEIQPDFSTPEAIIRNTQREMYVLNTNNTDPHLSIKEEETLEKINISKIAHTGVLTNIASTFDKNDGMIRDSFNEKGPHLITFDGILKYNVFPLAKILKDILAAGQKSIGSPVEIEFAVNIDPAGKKPPVFALIQIRPLVISQEKAIVTWEDTDIDKESLLIKSNKALGNGINPSIKDILYIPPNTFDVSKTTTIADEIGGLNKKLTSTPYLLIGPGRWGTQDQWLGIPVEWSDISNVRIIVETALPRFNIKPSQGTHFFQNIISRGIGYINIPLNQQDSYIDWQWLNSHTPIHTTTYVKHIHLQKPLLTKLDGRNGRAIIIKPKHLQ